MTGPTATPGPAGAAEAAPEARRRRGGPPLLLAVLAGGSLVAGILLIAAQLLGLGTGAAAPATMAPPGRAAQLTHDLVVKALGDASFQVRDPLTDYRPGESPALYAVPRRLVQVVLPEEPLGGYIVIYELPSNTEADRIGREFVAYLASGTGAIQYPADTRFVLRRQGPTLVFFAWSPTADPDVRVTEVAATLETVGVPLTGG